MEDFNIKEIREVAFENALTEENRKEIEDIIIKIKHEAANGKFILKIEDKYTSPIVRQYFEFKGFSITYNNYIIKRNFIPITLISWN